ncbi:hypothetical protein Ait01nite_052980 [Actinoplanes italicus]|uniref:Uncharacterized protein n=1 Tax=Actinoplanes italicus TaxID=113567 RepID=A0A2T0JZN4_9ACTN|nr:hypothetical protein [Actinoplanes italicus]PRX15987.1 hypothetical protein CLV67_12134 [Actinoplanes italicus]GIE32253.1 hypothetical protein Ait01nite_052980 [Actinoplanes italicus]
MSAERDSLASFKGRVDADRLDELWADYTDGPELDETPSQVLDQHLFGILKEQDPSARLERWLNLRLTGARATGGRLDIGITQEVFHAFAQEVAGAAELNSIREGVSLELAGVSEGSAILHLVPARQIDENCDGQLAVDVDPVDEVLSTITDLHHTAESQGDLRRFAGHEPLVRGLRMLASALDEHDLDLEVGWRSGTGQHRNSRLDRRTRQFLKKLWEVRYTEQSIPVSGFVVRLDLGGTFSLKVGRARNSRRYDIHVAEDQNIVDLQLALGEFIHVWAIERKRINHLGIEQSSTYHFVRMNGDQLTF